MSDRANEIYEEIEAEAVKFVGGDPNDEEMCEELLLTIASQRVESLERELAWVDSRLVELQIAIRRNVFTPEFAAGLIDIIRNRKGFRQQAPTSPTPTAFASPLGSPSA